MTKQEHLSALKNSDLQPGMNYLIADGTVYGAMKYINAGIAFTEIWQRDHADYLPRYMSAAKDTHTLFWGRQEGKNR